MFFAKVVAGIVVGLSSSPLTGYDIAAPSEVRLGWTYDGSKFTRVDLMPTPAKAAPAPMEVAALRSELFALEDKLDAAAISADETNRMVKIMLKLLSLSKDPS